MVRKIFWRLACVFALLTSAVPAGPRQAFAALPVQVIIPQPALTPAPGALCTSYWYELTNAYLTNSAYLTQNVTHPADSSNFGEWRPSLAAAGFYQVEVYIPAHAPIVWTCATSKTINSDTDSARYIIQTGAGVYTVTVDQAASAGQWVNLGSYYFTGGASGALTLSDLTGGTAFTRTVSFSAARFTPDLKSTRLMTPLLASRAVTVANLSLTSFHALGRELAPRARFDAFEPVVYRLQGDNSGSAPQPASLTWSLAGPCGAGEIAQTTPTLAVGAWTHSLTTTIPACTGTYTVTAQVSGTVLSKTAVYKVDPGGQVRVINRPMFDLSSLPALSTMQTWWSASPYWGMAVYLGGASFCSFCTFVRDVNRGWIKDAQKMGWSFLPIWVGPQAPCTTRNTAKMSLDPDAARQEGRNEALLAYSAAIKLGLTEAVSMTTTIYYDIEAYPNQAACHTAVGQFLNGWTEQLHVFQIKSGAYGIPASANYGNWAGLSNPPDAVWLATYINQGYSSAITVFDIPNYNAALFANHQRVFQYSGDFKETWGDKSLTIDSNIADAPLLVSLAPPAAGADPALADPALSDPALADPALAAASPAPAAAVTVLDRVSDFQMLDARQGWALVNGRFQWTADGGKTWQALPQPAPLAAGLKLAQAYFRSQAEGWILAQTSAAEYVLLHTTDGADWDVTPIPGAAGTQPSLLAFDRSGGGLLAFTQPGLLGQSETLLMQTDNLGVTWESASSSQAPSLSVAPRRSGVAAAWTLNLGAGYALDVFTGVPVAAGLISPKVMTLPPGADRVAFVSPTQAWASTFEGDCSGVKGTPGFACQVQTALWSTTDGGATWKLLIK